MVLSQNIDFSPESKTPGFGEVYADLEKLLPKIQNDKIRIFDFSDKASKLNEAYSISAETSKKADYLFVLGTGGATLCGQTLLGLRENCFNEKKKVIFVDNIDPLTLQNIADNIDFSNSHFLVISKSGGTLETISQFLFFLSLAEKKSKVSDVFTVLTDKDNSPNIIREIAENLKLKIYSHDKVGGRFSIFTLVSLIAGAFAGIDITKFLNSSEKFFEESFNLKDKKAIESAALNIIYSDKFSSAIIFPYEDRLRRFAFWYCQIYAESLGKNAKPMTPVKAFGTLDQHSVMQQFLEGRKDKFFTLIASERKNKGTEISSSSIKKFAPEYLKSKKIGDVIEASFLSTVETFAKNNIPVRIIRFPEMNEEALGSLCALSILEIVLIAYYFNINAFDQPAVEQGKKIALKILTENL